MVCAVSTEAKHADEGHDDQLPAVEDMSFEEAAEELEAINDRIESGEIGLEDSLRAYERGMKLIARCRAILDAAEQRVEEISGADLTARSGVEDEEPEEAE
jgi:exodeoxyribonuclease VII small subunit